MYKNYIFDLYGTLIDIKTDEDNLLLWEKLSLFFSFKGANYSSNELKLSYTKLVNYHLEKVAHSGYPEINLENIFFLLYKNKNIIPSLELITDTAQFFRILSIKYIKLYDGVIDLLSSLKANNKNIYLLSNAQRVFTLYEMKLLNIEQYFDDILFSSDYDFCKPDKNFFNTLIKKHNLNPSECIMIGNDPICDIQGAINVGIDTLYLHSNLSPDLTLNNTIKSNFKIMDMNLSKILELTIKEQNL